MSKPVRLPEYLYAEIERLAKEEKRSLANMVRVLLDQALQMDDQPITRETITNISRDTVVTAQVPTTPRNERAVDLHFKPDPK